MSPSYLLDSDTCILLVRGRNNHARQHLAQRKPSEIAIPAIAFGELYFGALHSQRVEANLLELERLTSLIPIHPLPESACQQYGIIRVSLGRKGLIIGPNDLWIAAHALALDATLVTNNTDEFRRVPNLRVENWFR